MADVLKFPGSTILDCKPEDVLEDAKTWDMKFCVIVGFDQENQLVHGGSTSDIANVILVLEMAKSRLLRMIEDEDED